MNLKELLKERTDFDIAMYYLACCLGLMKYDETFEELRKAKTVFWAKNEMGDFLYETLNGLVKLNILEENEDGYIWNESYKGYWEK